MRICGKQQTPISLNRIMARQSIKGILAIGITMIIRWIISMIHLKLSWKMVF